MSLAYDDGYAACPCFWGREPGSLIGALRTLVPSLAGASVLDAGCGEGKNAAFFARHGANVRALDYSALALQNAALAWKGLQGIQWEQADLRLVETPANAYDVVVAYGLFHCYESADEIERGVLALQEATKPSGFHVVCAFNDRYQELTHAHPGFTPTLLSHLQYAGFYAGWKVHICSDTDLREVHPHNGIEHTHSMTRIVAQKP